MLKHTPKLRTGTGTKYLQMAQLQPAECACFFLSLLEYPTYILSLLLCLPLGKSGIYCEEGMAAQIDSASISSVACQDQTQV